MWVWVMPVVLDQPQRLRRRPAVHEDDAHAAQQGPGQRERQRRRVVQRAGAQVQRLARAVARGRHGPAADGLVVGAVDALGAPGGARRVQHGPAQHRVGDVGRVLLRQRGVERGEAVDLATHRQPQRRRRGAPRRLGRHRREAGVGHERLGLAVVDDVGGLLRGEVPVHRGEPQPGPQHGRVGHRELGPVGHHGRHPVARLQAVAPQGSGQPVGVGVELGVGPVAAGAARGHDGRQVGMALRPVGQRHPRAHGRPQRLPLGVEGGSRLGHLSSSLWPGSLGRPSTRSPTMLRWTWAVPPQMVPERLPRNSVCQRSRG